MTCVCATERRKSDLLFGPNINDILSNNQYHSHLTEHPHRGRTLTRLNVTNDSTLPIPSNSTERQPAFPTRLSASYVATLSKSYRTRLRYVCEYASTALIHYSLFSVTASGCKVLVMIGDCFSRTAKIARRVGTGISDPEHKNVEIFHSKLDAYFVSVTRKTSSL